MEHKWLQRLEFAIVSAKSKLLFIVCRKMRTNHWHRFERENFNRMEVVRDGGNENDDDDLSAISCHRWRVVERKSHLLLSFECVCGEQCGTWVRVRMTNAVPLKASSVVRYARKFEHFIIFNEIVTAHEFWRDERRCSRTEEFADN